jgi:hypothetical protein
MLHLAWKASHKSDRVCVSLYDQKLVWFALAILYDTFYILTWCVGKKPRKKKEEKGQSAFLRPS